MRATEGVFVGVVAAVLLPSRSILRVTGVKAQQRKLLIKAARPKVKATPAKRIP
jgi:hypothetical protein